MFYRVDKVFKSLYMIDNQMKLISEKRYGCLVTLVVPSFMISDRRISVIYKRKGIPNRGS